MSGHKFTIEKHDELVAYFKSEALLAVPVYENKTFTTPQYFGSVQDFASFVGDLVSEDADFDEKTYNVNYLVMTFANFADAKTKGSDDEPTVFVTYRFQLFRKTVEARDTGTNSHDLLLSEMIALRNRFLRNKDIIVNKTDHTGLAQNGDMVLVQESEYIVGVIGDWVNFRIQVEINS